MHSITQENFLFQEFKTLHRLINQSQSVPKQYTPLSQNDILSINFMLSTMSQLGLQNQFEIADDDLKLYAGLKAFFIQQGYDINEVLKQIRLKLASQLDQRQRTQTFWQLIYIVYITLYLNRERHPILLEHFAKQDIQSLAETASLISKFFKVVKPADHEALEEQAINFNELDLGQQVLKTGLTDGSDDVDDEENLLMEDPDSWDIFDDRDKFEKRDKLLKQKRHKVAQIEMQSYKQIQEEEEKEDFRRQLEIQVDQLKLQVKRYNEQIQKKIEKEKNYVHEIADLKAALQDKESLEKESAKKNQFMMTFKHKYESKRQEVARLVERMHEYTKSKAVLMTQIENQNRHLQFMQQELNSFKQSESTTELNEQILQSPPRKHSKHGHTKSLQEELQLQPEPTELLDDEEALFTPELIYSNRQSPNQSFARDSPDDYREKYYFIEEMLKVKEQNCKDYEHAYHEQVILSIQTQRELQTIRSKLMRQNWCSTSGWVLAVSLLALAAGVGGFLVGQRF